MSDIFVPTRLFSVDEYYQMSSLGILKPDERVELIEGTIIPMAAKNPPHAATNNCAGNYLRELLAGLALVRIQDPIHLNDRSEPEPDIAVVRTHPREYLDRHPTPEEVFLLIEVADSTLKFDTEVKDLVYARAGIIEYWVLDINFPCVHTFRNPTQKGYANKEILDVNASLAPVCFSHVNFKVTKLFP